MGYNGPRYIHTVYQAMSMAFADRDFYYGDPYTSPGTPIAGLLSKEYAKERAKLIMADKNDPNIKPGDPYPFQNAKNPYLDTLSKWTTVNPFSKRPDANSGPPGFGIVETEEQFRDAFYGGTTSVQAADAEGWVVSVTPSGGWIPAVIAGKTGIGLSQRAQSFVTDPTDNPFNVIAPGKRPRVTLTPTLAMKGGKPFMAFSVQGGDSQDQNLLQFFLNTVEFEMTVQRATEAPNINSFQMRSSFGEHESRPGRLLLANSTPQNVRDELTKMGYTLVFEERTSGPITAIFLDQAHGSMWGGASNHGDDYGRAW
jgi:gamma-glutamyltranspeptidase/glutathione hydrolase